MSRARFLSVTTGMLCLSFLLSSAPSAGASPKPYTPACIWNAETLTLTGDLGKVPSKANVIQYRFEEIRGGNSSGLLYKKFPKSISNGPITPSNPDPSFTFKVDIYDVAFLQLATGTVNCVKVPG